MRYGNYTIDYLGGEKIENGFAGRFCFADKAARTVVLTNNLADIWHINDKEAAIEEIGPLYLIARSKRGILADYYELNEKTFGSDNDFDSTVKYLTGIANAPMDSY